MRAAARPRWLSGLAAAWLLGTSAPHAARGQMLHPIPKGPRPLHVRIDAADAIAIGRVAAIDEGRIEIGEARALLGAPGDSFLVKRSPSAPPPLAVGVHALLLLRGARSPYLLVDGPGELAVLRDAQEVAAWEGGLGELLSARGDPPQLLAVYLGWLDGPRDSLREVASAALLDRQGGWFPLPAEVALARARVALDPSAALPARRVSALLAATEPRATEALLAGVPGEDGDPQVVETALRAGALAAAPELRRVAVLRALDHADPDIRRAALRAAPALWSDALAARVEAMQTRDPDRRVREEAASATASAGALRAN